MSVPASIHCYFRNLESSWKCVRCGLEIQKSMHPEKPFAACREGMKQMGIPYTNIALATVANGMFTPPPPRKQLVGRPGTELKAMLGKIGIRASAGCSCNQKALIMDSWGPDLCEENLDSHIIPWLREEAEKRKLPFIEIAARLLVKRAIAKARRKMVAAEASS